MTIWCNGYFQYKGCGSEHISLITLIRATIDELNGQNEVPNDDCIVWVQLPWSGERVQVNSDIELLDYFRVFEDHGLDTIVFELENVYVPNPPGDEEPEVLAQDSGYQPLGWHDLEAEMLNYYGDSEKDDDKDDEEGKASEASEAGEGEDNYGQVPIVDEDAEDGNDGNDRNDGNEENNGNDDIIKECMSLFEGYQSKCNDEYFSDSELEPDKVKIAKLMKGNPFKKMVGGEIKFHVGQTFDNAVQMREIFREYAILQGVVLHRVKNDNVRQTYKCLGDGCRWRAHGSRMIDRMTFMIKTLVDEHEYHRVYNNKEAKVKWIASKFENLVKINPSIDIKVLVNEIGAIDPTAKSWLQNIKTAHWSRFDYDPIVRCDHVTINMTEAFNSMLGSHRAKSYLELLEFIRRMVMRKFQERKDECKQWNFVLPPRVNAKIMKNSKESRLFTIIAAGNGEYELLGPTGGYGVKLRKYSCQCGYWQMSGIPCSYAMAAISHYCGKSVT
ncbi:hypothetical protein EZV62_024237 [Acer yangbiense]|uniref:Zinc finger PMZ-type domain-containing protein n=1 Tax=Acer yangbiense TaxID=1000413 RepID=A0A5C7H3Y9_9ROSI|nr:hypothetical protein EZV62_024237 [Acer yangbiense]